MWEPKTMSTKKQKNPQMILGDYKVKLIEVADSEKVSKIYAEHFGHEYSGMPKSSI